MDTERLLAGLNDAQRAAVTSSAAPLCIIAGAGSGKTRVLTRRIGYRVATGDADPRHVLALTFTRKAAGELGSRLRALGTRDAVAAGTFHSVAYAQLRARWAERGVRPPELLDRKVRFVAGLLPRDVKAVDVVTEIEWATARRITPDAYEGEAARAGRTPPVRPSLVASTFARYQDAKRQRRLVDFDDLLRLCIRDLRDPEVAAVQRWRFRHLFVDEFQDVNPLQFDLLRAWLGDRTDLCVVGDPNQAIYAWNGADAGYLNHFERWFPGAGQVELAENYRSSPQVLAVANAVLSPARPRSSPLRANRADGPAPVVVSFGSDADEATGIARAVRDAHAPGSPWSSQAVLVRTNAQTALISEALREAGIPHRLRGGTGLLEQAEVRTALAGMRRHTGTFAAAVADLAATIDEGEPPGGDDAGDAPSDLSDAVAERRASLEMLVRLAHDYERIDPMPSAVSFAAWLRATVGSDAPDRDAVDVTTFHAAKGLEWPVVHLGGVEKGLVPIGHATTSAAQAEERRLFYVAVTRAEKVLRCTWAQTRTFGERVASREASPYLDQVQAAVAAAASGGAPASGWPEIMRQTREQLETREPRSRRPGRRARRSTTDDLDPADTEVFEALKRWRSSKAKAAGVPAYVIFSDATLVAVAGSRPSTRTQLRGLPGIGPVKVERHGDELLAVVADHG